MSALLHGGFIRKILQRKKNNIILKLLLHLQIYTKFMFYLISVINGRMISLPSGFNCRERNQLMNSTMKCLYENLQIKPTVCNSEWAVFGIVAVVVLIL